jgi:hypothetical protein
MDKWIWVWIESVMELVVGFYGKEKGYLGLCVGCGWKHKKGLW